MWTCVDSLGSTHTRLETDNTNRHPCGLRLTACLREVSKVHTKGDKSPMHLNTQMTLSDIVLTLRYTNKQTNTLTHTKAGRVKLVVHLPHYFRFPGRVLRPASRPLRLQSLLQRRHLHRGQQRQPRVFLSHRWVAITSVSAFSPQKNSVFTNNTFYKPKTWPLFKQALCLSVSVSLWLTG